MKSMNEIGAVFAWQARAIELLAALAHDQWSGWMKYLFEKCQQAASTRATFYNGPGVVIPAPSVERWVRQMNTPYADLPEEEKESDRVEARKVLNLLVDLLREAGAPHFDFKLNGGGVTVTCDCPPPASWEPNAEGISTCTGCGSQLVVGERHISVVPGRRA